MSFLGGAAATTLLFIVLAFIYSWPPQAVGGTLQLVGIILTLLGVEVVRSSLKLAQDKANEAKQGLDSLWASGREHVRTWWARRRQRPIAVELELHATATSDASLELTVQRRRVDRKTISDRDWLAFLDDRLESVFELMDQAEQNRGDERDDITRRLATQGRQLRGEIQRQTRQGWQLIVAGLVWSAVGTVFGIFA